MKIALDYILSAIYMLYFGLILAIFHILQLLAYNLIGYKAHQNVVKYLNFFICYGWLITGTTIKIKHKAKLVDNQSYIFVANHQSTFDIPGIIWYFRKYTPLFVAKIELAKGIPSISYNLRKSGAALINRKDKRQAKAEIAKLGGLMASSGTSAAIFPEGTRARSGKLKDFATGGIAILLKNCPDAIIVPIAIKNTAQFNPKGIFPLTSFCRLSWTSLPEIDPKNKSVDELIQLAKKAIAAELTNESEG